MTPQILPADNPPSEVWTGGLRTQILSGSGKKQAYFQGPKEGKCGRDELSLSLTFTHCQMQLGKPQISLWDGAPDARGQSSLRSTTAHQPGRTETPLPDAVQPSCYFCKQQAPSPGKQRLPDTEAASQQTTWHGLSSPLPLKGRRDSHYAIWT